MGEHTGELRYIGGHAFKEEESGYVFVFNVLTEGRATGITGVPPEMNRVEVYELIED